MKKFVQKYIKYISLSILIGIVSVLIFIVSPSKESISTPTTPTNEEKESSKKFFSSLSTLVQSKKIELTVVSGDTFSSLMLKAGVQQEQTKEILESFKGVFDIRTLQPSEKNKIGDKIVIYYQDGEQNTINVVKLEIIRSQLEKIQTSKSGDVFVSSKKTQTATTKLVRKEGTIGQGQSFIEVASAQNIPYNIIAAFYDIFAFDLDFARDVRDGDTFSILYEEKYSPNGTYIGEGALIYGNYKSYFKPIEIYRHTTEDGKVGYYDSKGNGAQKALKKTPINGARISSSYGSRRHPVLGFTRQHKGVDFAAPSGTPIPAAGDGVVEFRGTKGGYGNYIKIRHNGSYATAYAHMSSFKSGVVSGTRVKQGQIVGYVGSTGISTGPHLHYEIIKNGVHVNPITVKMPSISNLKDAELDRFLAKKNDIDTQFALLNQKFIKFVHLLSYE